MWLLRLAVLTTVRGLTSNFLLIWNCNKLQGGLLFFLHLKKSPLKAGFSVQVGLDYFVSLAAVEAALALRLPFLATRLVFVTALATGLSAAGAAGAAAGAAMGAPVCDAAWAVVYTASGTARTAEVARIDRNFFMVTPVIERG